MAGLQLCAGRFELRRSAMNSFVIMAAYRVAMPAFSSLSRCDRGPTKQWRCHSDTAVRKSSIRSQEIGYAVEFDAGRQ